MQNFMFDEHGNITCYHIGQRTIWRTFDDHNRLIQYKTSEGEDLEVEYLPQSKRMTYRNASLQQHIAWEVDQDRTVKHTRVGDARE